MEQKQRKAGKSWINTTKAVNSFTSEFTAFDFSPALLLSRSDSLPVLVGQRTARRCPIHLRKNLPEFLFRNLLCRHATILEL